MRKIRIIGMAFVAVFAMSAMVASAAQAGEYFHCAEVAKGKWLNAKCTEAGAGKFEKVAGPGARPGYTSTDKTATLTSAGGTITCTASTDKGRITGTKTDTDKVTFTGCTTKVGEETVACQNIGTETKPAPEGVINTYLLDSKLIDHGEKGLSGKEPASGEVWNEFVSSEHEPYQAEYECGGKGTGLGEWFRVSGSLSGVVTPVNTMSLTSTTTFTAAGGEQDLLVADSTNHGMTWSVPIAATEVTTATTTFEEVYEVRAI
jgi:hypothetical protein